MQYCLAVTFHLFFSVFIVTLFSIVSQSLIFKLRLTLSCVPMDYIMYVMLSGLYCCFARVHKIRLKHLICCFHEYCISSYHITAVTYSVVIDDVTIPLTI